MRNRVSIEDHATEETNVSLLAILYVAITDWVRLPTDVNQWKIWLAPEWKLDKLLPNIQLRQLFLCDQTLIILLDANESFFSVRQIPLNFFASIQHFKDKKRYVVVCFNPCTGWYVCLL